MLLGWPLGHEPGIVYRTFKEHKADGSGAPGIDIAVPLGFDVVALGDGQILRSRYTRRAGRSIWLLCGAVRIFYAHLDQVFALEGENVARGATIATTGCTGRCEIPHLHISVKWDGEWIDPTRLVKPSP